MIKVVVFDWGGVLAEPDTSVAIKELENKYDFDHHEFTKYFDENEDKYSTNDDYEEIIKGASKITGAMGNEIISALNKSNITEVYDIAKKIAEKSDVYILSNQIKYRTDNIKEKFDLSFFKKAFFSNEIGLVKPNRDIFEFLLKEISAEPENVLFIDDNINNIRAASILSINTIYFKDINQIKDEIKEFGFDL